MAWEEIIFPNNIREIRSATGMKMTELARRTKLSLSAVSKIEKGVRRLNQNQLIGLCDILGCKLSDIFIKESDDIADIWRGEINRRLTGNAGSGLKIFGCGLRAIRQKSGKTIVTAAADAGMTLSVYHKIEVGQREVYETEIEPLAASFGFTVDKFFDEIAKLYKSGELDKIKTSAVSPDDELQDSMYGAKLYDSARRKLIPVFGTPLASGITFNKFEKNMIPAPYGIDGAPGIYAVSPNADRLCGIISAKSYILVDSNLAAVAGDMAVCLDADFETLSSNDTASAQIAIIKKDAKGKLFGQVSGPDEKIYFKSAHKVIMIIMG